MHHGGHDEGSSALSAQCSNVQSTITTLHLQIHRAASANSELSGVWISAKNWWNVIFGARFGTWHQHASFLFLYKSSNDSFFLPLYHQQEPSEPMALIPEKENPQVPQVASDYNFISLLSLLQLFFFRQPLPSNFSQPNRWPLLLATGMWRICLWIPTVNGIGVLDYLAAVGIVVHVSTVL